MATLTHFAHSRLSWFVLGSTALSLEAAALFFQYVVKLDPCVMCVYQRLAIFGLFIAGFVGCIAPHSRLIRLLGAAIWGISATWGLKIALELVDMQNNPSPFSTCPFLPEFPSWMPLHEWFPAVMLPTGMCTEVPWAFLGITMAEWMIIAFSGFILAWLLFIIPIMMNGTHKLSLFRS